MILQQNRLKRQIRTCRESGDSGINLDDFTNNSSNSPTMSPTRPWSPSCTDFSNILNVYSDSSCSNECAMNTSGITSGPQEECRQRFRGLIQEVQDKLESDRQISGGF